MKLSEFIEEMQEMESLWLWDAEIILSIVTNGDRKIHKEYDDSVVSTCWKYIFLSDFQREGKTRDFGEVVLWDDSPEIE